MLINNVVGNYKLKYNFESNSQLVCDGVSPSDVGNYKLKYNFESNSQQGKEVILIDEGWEL